MRLRFRRRPTRSFGDLGELEREQLGPLLEQAESDGPDGHELIALFDVLDDHDQHIYDLHLFCDDDGQLHRAGTLEHRASFSQGGATGTNDPALIAALDAAYAEWTATK